MGLMAHESCVFSSWRLHYPYQRVISDASMQAAGVGYMRSPCGPVIYVVQCTVILPFAAQSGLDSDSCTAHAVPIVTSCVVIPEFELAMRTESWEAVDRDVERCRQRDPVMIGVHTVRFRRIACFLRQHHMWCGVELQLDVGTFMQ